MVFIHRRYTAHQNPRVCPKPALFDASVKSLVARGAGGLSATLEPRACHRRHTFWLASPAARDGWSCFRRAHMPAHERYRLGSGQCRGSLLAALLAFICPGPRHGGVCALVHEGRRSAENVSRSAYRPRLCAFPHVTASPSRVRHGNGGLSPIAGGGAGVPGRGCTPASAG